MFLFGVLVHRMIISPALDKPHLVVVFATMGLSIFMQNVALMMMTADLWDVPPVFGHVGRPSARSISRSNCCSASPSRIVCTIALQWMIRTTYLGKAIRATVQDGEAAHADGHPGAANLPDHVCRRLGAGRACRPA